LEVEPGEHSQIAAFGEKFQNSETAPGRLNIGTVTKFRGKQIKKFTEALAHI
jgi:hypothetical protein